MNLPDITELARQDAADGVQQQIVGAVVDHKGEILLLRRLPGEFRGGAWELPSGKVEPGEDLLTALHREVAEETGLVIDEITGYLGAFDYTARNGGHYRQHTWSVVPRDADNIELSEHDAYRWVDAEQQYPVSDDLKRQIAAHFG
ncbi:NUDIX hydrolase [Saccharopolyspora taberi]|uniref:8-oxo-dGTP diphosphatase MutT n=1 Tax=Saccharopolyspora taberi TaxID=60895 RepID=A0ABN3VCP7_9PSEU